MKNAKKVLAYSNSSGVGIVRDRSGRISVVMNKGKSLKIGAVVYVRSHKNKDVV